MATNSTEKKEERENDEDDEDVLKNKMAKDILFSKLMEANNYHARLTDCT